MELTKEDFEKIISQKLEDQSKDLKKHAEGLQSELAAMVQHGFEDVLERLDVKERVIKLEAEMKELRAALHLN